MVTTPFLCARIKLEKCYNKNQLCEEWALAECEDEGWWRDTRDASSGEMDVRYAGTAPVERAASAPATALAVRSALHSAKLINKKLQRVNLNISARGIVVSDYDSQENVISVSIYRISYCSADAANARVFAVVEGKPAGGSAENHVVHVFVCTRRKHARALALSLAHAFNDAYQEWQANLNQGSSLGSDNKRLAPWVRFQEESDDELDTEDWQSPAPLVSFA
nr:low density lipoprotein receptor adapter protein 1 isoform X1 [Helicoverpa armigera]